MIDVYIGLGSNLAKPEEQIQAACHHLAAIANSRLVMCSSLYHSQPMGPQDQPDYVNAVALIQTTLSPAMLLQQTQSIENQQGRTRDGARWGPRTLDLDILLYGQQQIHHSDLIVPHKGMKLREFVLYPLFEIMPDLVLPCGDKLVDLVASCPKNGLQKMPCSVQI